MGAKTMQGPRMLHYGNSLCYDDNRVPIYQEVDTNPISYRFILRGCHRLYSSGEEIWGNGARRRNRVVHGQIKVLAPIQYLVGLGWHVLYAYG